MKITGIYSVLLATGLMCLPDFALARGFGGHGGGGGGARPGVGGGGGARPNFGGGGGARPNFGGAPARPNVGGAGGGARPNFGGGNVGNHTPSFSHPTGGGSARPDFGSGNRPEIGGGMRPGMGGSGTRNPFEGGGGAAGFRPGGEGGNRNPIAGGGFRPGGEGGGVRPGGGGERPGGGGFRPGGGERNPIAGGIGNRTGIGGNTNIGNRTNVGHFGNNNFNNINIASSRPYYGNWQHGNWNGHWNGPGGHGYWNGWAHGYAHGYWNGGWGGYWRGGPGNWGGYWGAPWYAAPIAWGLGAWALGSVMYNSGYAAYSNPYYYGAATTPAYYDYSQPISVINQQPDAYASSAFATPGNPADSAVLAANQPSPEVQAGTAHMDLARQAFQSGDYATALREVDLAIQSLPNDAALHEFRALVFFATQDYKQAAATLYAVLSAGPGWDWTTLSGMYDNIDTYTAQLRALEQYVRTNPTAADARFVLAYQYLVAGHTEAARREYAAVVKLQPKDQLSAQLLSLVGGDPTAAATASNQPHPSDAETAESATPPADVDAAKLVGNWQARRKDEAVFSLNLTKDAKFTWSYQDHGKKQEFGGKYSMDGPILVLERNDGAQMPGLITLSGNGFNFKLYGGPPDDPGLNFKS